MNNLLILVAVFSATSAFARAFDVQCVDAVTRGQVASVVGKMETLGTTPAGNPQMVADLTVVVNQETKALQFSGDYHSGLCFFTCGTAVRQIEETDLYHFQEGGGVFGRKFDTKIFIDIRKKYAQLEFKKDGHTSEPILLECEIKRTE